MMKVLLFLAFAVFASALPLLVILDPYIFHPIVNIVLIFKLLLNMEGIAKIKILPSTFSEVDLQPPLL